MWPTSFVDIRQYGVKTREGGAASAASTSYDCECDGSSTSHSVLACIALCKVGSTMV